MLQTSTNTGFTNQSPAKLYYWETCPQGSPSPLQEPPGNASSDSSRLLLGSCPLRVRASPATLFCACIYACNRVQGRRQSKDACYTCNPISAALSTMLCCMQYVCMLYVMHVVCMHAVYHALYAAWLPVCVYILHCMPRNTPHSPLTQHLCWVITWRMRVAAPVPSVNIYGCGWVGTTCYHTCVSVYICICMCMLACSTMLCCVCDVMYDVYVIHTLMHMICIHVCVHVHCMHTVCIHVLYVEHTC